MDPTGELWLVDPFHLSRTPVFNTGLMAARRTLAKSRNGSVHFLQSLSVEALASWDGTSLDLVFIDGDHSYEAVRADWEGWSKFVRPNGAVAFHDAISAPGHPEGPVRFIDETFRKTSPAGWRIAEEVGTLVVVVRTSE
jgi:predicted O-methyltransferase YrrM